VPHVTKQTGEVHAVLVKAGVSLTAGQIQRAIEANLGPLDDAVDPIGHWRAYSSLAAGPSRRLPEASEAAMALALAGFPTRHLPAAIGELATEGLPSWHESQDPEVEAQALIDHASEFRPTAQLIGRFLQGSRRSGDPWPAPRDAEGADLHHLGRVTAVVEDMVRAYQHPETIASVFDPGDLAACIGGDERTAALALNLVGSAVGSEPHPISHALTSASPAALAAAVAAACIMLPLAEALGTHVPRTARERWQLVATFTPVALLFADRIAAYLAADSEAAPSALLNREPTRSPTPEALGVLAQFFDRRDRIAAYREWSGSTHRAVAPQPSPSR
jgi:hypothetical protein